MPIVKLSNVRTSFFNGFTPQVNQNDDGTTTKSFNTDLIFDKAHPQMAELNAAIRAAAAERWGDKADAVLKVLKTQGRICLRDGDTKMDKEGEVRDGYAGHAYIRASNKKRPTLVDRDGSPLTEADGRPYSGCYVNVILDLWAQDHPKGGRRINAMWMGAQFVKDGESFGGGGKTASPDDFETLADEFGTDEEESLV